MAWAFLKKVVPMFDLELCIRDLVVAYMKTVNTCAFCHVRIHFFTWHLFQNMFIITRNSWILALKKPYLRHYSICLRKALKNWFIKHGFVRGWRNNPNGLWLHEAVIMLSGLSSQINFGEILEKCEL